MIKKVYHGRRLVILRHQGGVGKITLTAKAEGLPDAWVIIETRRKIFNNFL
jgi:hypothetical protein